MGEGEMGELGCVNLTICNALTIKIFLFLRSI